MIRLAFGGVLAASLAMAASLAVADEARVGAAGPVIPHAMGIMPDGTSRPLLPGQDIVLHEKITPVAILCAVLVIVGVALVLWRGRAPAAPVPGSAGYQKI